MLGLHLTSSFSRLAVTPPGNSKRRSGSKSRDVTPTPTQRKESQPARKIPTFGSSWAMAALASDTEDEELEERPFANAQAHFHTVSASKCSLFYLDVSL